VLDWAQTFSDDDEAQALKASGQQCDVSGMHSQLALQPAMTSGLDLSEFLIQVFRDALSGLLATPWLAGLKIING
jgi:hypothetical protein